MEKANTQTNSSAAVKRDVPSASMIDPTLEFEFWRNEFGNRPYVAVGSSYEQYAPAYRYGWESYQSFAAKGCHFNEVEAELGHDWNHHRGLSKLSWESARNATQDAWRRVQNAAWRSAFDQG